MDNSNLYSQLIGAGLPLEMVERLMAQIQQNSQMPSQFSTSPQGMGGKGAVRVSVPNMQRSIYGNTQGGRPV
jgi:hypothetical protein